MRLSRESIFIILLLISLGVAVVYGVLQRAESSVGWRGSVQSDRPDGAQLLYLWLSNLGYSVHTLDQSPLSLSRSDEVLFVLATNDAFTTAELGDLDQWVESGGTLIVARDTTQPGQLLDHYQIPLARMWSSVERAPLHLPALDWPPVGEAQVHASYKLRLKREVAVVHIGDRNTPLLVAFGLGKGKVFVMSIGRQIFMFSTWNRTKPRIAPCVLLLIYPNYSQRVSNGHWTTHDLQLGVENSCRL